MVSFTEWKSLILMTQLSCLRVSIFESSVRSHSLSLGHRYSPILSSINFKGYSVDPCSVVT